MTVPAPTASESGRLRLGFLTSPAVKVTLFHASAENNDPTCATATTTNTPSNPLSPTEGNEANDPVFCQKFEKLAATACGLRAIVNPRHTKPSNAATFAIVKMFCTIAPVLTPKTLIM